MTQRRWRWLLAAVMLAGLLFALRPLNSRLDPETLFPFSDKVSHLLYFGSLWWLARRGDIPARWPLAAGLVMYGASIEIAQALTPTHREASLADVVADSAGIALGWWFLRDRVGLRSAGQPEEHRR
jgi:VanZ family protein